MGPQPHTY
eukprot:gene21097-biopygen8619